jgi:hypothetical protein
MEPLPQLGQASALSGNPVHMTVNGKSIYMKFHSLVEMPPKINMNYLLCTHPADAGRFSNIFCTCKYTNNLFLI